MKTMQHGENHDTPQSVESGDPLQDGGGAFRRALGHFATGVTIVTARWGDRLVGATVNSFASLSLDPPLVLWSIRKASSSFEAFTRSGAFAVNVLSSDQAALAMRFAKTSETKFDGLTWETRETGSPVLPGCVASFDCTTEACHEAGDHVLLIGRVVHFARFERRPLVFVGGRFGLAVDRPEDESDPGPAHGASPTFLTLIRRAFVTRSAQFRLEAEAMGFTINESRLTFHIADRPGLGIADLAQASQLEIEAAQDGVSDLVERGWVHGDAAGGLWLTPLGSERNKTLRTVASQAERRTLKTFSPGEIDVARRILAALDTEPPATSGAPEP